MSFQLRSRVDAAKSKLAAASSRALREITLDLAGKAISRAPIETGDLRGSGASEVISEGEQDIGAVGFSTPYAVVQHESLDFDHPNGGEAKYLERPYLENRERYKAHLGRAVRGEFG